MEFWEEMKGRLLGHFGSSHEGSLCERFLALRQELTVQEFHQNFEVGASVLKGLSKQVLESVFING